MKKQIGLFGAPNFLKDEEVDWTFWGLQQNAGFGAPIGHPCRDVAKLVDRRTWELGK